MKKKRAVKEGSPFEEEYLLELLHEDTKVTEDDKASVKAFMKVLLHYGLIDEASALHLLIERMLTV